MRWVAVITLLLIVLIWLVVTGEAQYNCDKKHGELVKKLNNTYTCMTKETK